MCAGRGRAGRGAIVGLLRVQRIGGTRALTLEQIHALMATPFGTPIGEPNLLQEKERERAREREKERRHWLVSCHRMRHMRPALHLLALVPRSGWCGWRVAHACSRTDSDSCRTPSPAPPAARD